MRKTFLQSINSMQAISRLGFGFLALLFSVAAFGQVPDCDEAYIACNDNVQISLNLDCEVVVDYDMIVEDPYDPTYMNDDGMIVPSYAIEIQDLDGNPLFDDSGDPLTVIGEDFEGQTLKIKVTYLPCDISCWGHATIEDKFPPQIITCADITVSCDTEIDTLSLKNNSLYTAFYRPIVLENCQGEMYEHTDYPGAVLCEDGFAQIYTRVWEISDRYENTSSCIQKIFVERADVDDIIFPADYIVDPTNENFCASSSACFGQNPSYSPPTEDDFPPSIAGMPDHYACPNLDFFYTDVPFDMCGVSVKMLRTWFAIDWCTGETREEGQNIEFLDTEPPLCTATTVDTFYRANADLHTCLADLVIAEPMCVCDVDANVTFTVEWLGADESGDPLSGPYSSDGVVSIGSGGYTIEDLPVGPYWLKFVVTDGCGNSTECFTEAKVEGSQNPHAVCEANTIIELGPDHTATMYGETQLDDNSIDPCGSIVNYMIKRVNEHCDDLEEDLEYGDFVTFCCDDLDRTDIQVMLKVTDNEGNTDECTGVVNVTGDISASVTCPTGSLPDVDCGEDYTVGTFPDVTISYDSDCSVPTSESVAYSGTLDCGVGTITRTVTVRNSNTGTTIKTCSLSIDVVNNDPFGTADIDCPDDIVVDGCNGSTSPDVIGGKPSLSNNSSCSDLVMSYDDVPVSDWYVSPYCSTFKRVWTIIDWCRYDVDNPTEGVFTCEQLIHINSATGPVFTSSCENITVAGGFSCEAEVSLVAVAIDSDGCTPGSQLTYTWQIDAGNNGSYDFDGVGNDASGTYPVGTHKVKFTATDACGNDEMCMYTFTVTGTNGPTPICRAHLIIGMGNNGVAEIWASDFDIKSEAGCGSDEDLSFSFTEDGNTPALDYDCDDIENGIGQTFDLNVYVIDEGGMSEFCAVTLEIQDNKDVCLDADDMARIQGKVYNEDFIGLESFDVALHEDQVNNSLVEATDEEGDYSFESVEFYDAYEVDPENDIHPLNGVSTLDIVIIQQHILGFKDLDSPYKIIAADVNNSEDITALDLLDIRRLILGVTADYPNNESWTFVNANHVFLDPNTPWDYARTFTIPSMYVDITNAEFIAVKTGDVNGSVMEGFTGDDAETRSNISYDLNIEDRSFAAGEQFTVSFNAAESIQTVGLQASLGFDQNVMELVSYEGNLVSLNDWNVVSKAGHFAISADYVQGLHINENEALFSLTFKAKEAGTLSDLLSITNTVEAEIYNQDLSISELDLNYRDDVSSTEKGFELYQNEPNPFSNVSMIPFYTPENAEVNLTVYDAAGRVLLEQSNSFAKGFQSFEIEADKIDQNGILIYRVESGDFSQMKKMVLLK